MSVTFNLELNNKPTKNKTYVVLLRITQDKKHTRKKTTIEVKNKSDFNPKAKYGSWIRTSEPKHKKWNQDLENEIEEAKKTYRELKKTGLATGELIKSSLNLSETSTSFLVYAKQRTKDIFNEGGYRNYKKYNGFCNKLENYLADIGRKDVLVSEITTSFLSRFEGYLYTLNNARIQEAKLNPSTISLNLRIFKTLINRAIEVDKLIKPEANPFLGFKYNQAKSAPKEKLTEEEIAIIENLDLPENSLIWHCRNYFLFSFYLAGIRAGDLIQLRWCNVTSEGRLEYRMGKTQKDRSLKLHDKPLKILEKYYRDDAKPNDFIFPLLDNNAPYSSAVTPEQKATLSTHLMVKLNDTVSSKNALINKYLKKIALQAELSKKLSFHISRHSFAKIAMDKQVDNNHLKNLLGHSSIKITETYMGNFDTSQTDSVMSSIFDKKEKVNPKIHELIEMLSPEEIEDLLTNFKKSKT